MGEGIETERGEGIGREIAIEIGRWRGRDQDKGMGSIAIRWVWQGTGMASGTSGI